MEPPEFSFLKDFDHSIRDRTEVERPIVCFRCCRPPDKIAEYVRAAADEDITPEHYVVREEGTYNPETRTFACTRCYIAIGQPSTRYGWKAPERGQ